MQHTCFGAKRPYWLWSFIFASVICCRPAKIYAQELPDTRIINSSDTAEIRRLIGYARGSANKDTAVTVLERARQLSIKAQFVQGEMEAIVGLGVELANAGHYKEAILLSRQTLVTHAHQPQARPYFSKLLLNIANASQMMGNYYEAIQYYYAVLNTPDTHKDSVMYAKTFTGLAAALNLTNETSKALYYLYKAEKIADDTKDYKTLASIMLNIAIGLSQLNYYDSAEHYYHKSLKLASEYHFDDVMHNVHTNLGQFYVNRQLPEKALHHLKAAERTVSEVNLYYRNHTTALIGIAYTYLKEYQLAEVHLLEALKQARQAGLERNMYEINKALSNVYASTGQYQKAYTHINEYIWTRDSIMDNEKLKTGAQLEVQYRTALKDKELAEQKLLITSQKNHLQIKNILIGSISIGGILLAVTLVSVYSMSRHRQHTQNRQLQILKQEQEIEQLKAMMQGEENERSRIARELHDGIGGMLAAIRAKLSVVKNRQQIPAAATADELDDVLYMVLDTAAEVRKTAHNLMPDVLTRHSLIQALALYCDNCNMSGQTKIDLQVHGDFTMLDKATELVLYRMGQELIQNILKHAGATHAIIQMIESGGKISLMIEDNGVGFDTAEIEGGYGLQNLRFRVQALNGELSVASVKNRGTTIYIEFDFENMRKI